MVCAPCRRRSAACLKTSRKRIRKCPSEPKRRPRIRRSAICSAPRHPRRNQNRINAGRSPYYFDKALARAAVEFFSKYLRLTLGEWGGCAFELDPWQAFHTSQIFGWRRRSDGSRRYRRVRGFIPKKNGKTEWFAGIGHLLTVADNEPGAEVYCYARDLAQASILFERAARMVTLDYDPLGNAGKLASLYEPSRTSLFCPALMAAFKPIAGNVEGKHGPAAHGALGDEAHEWKDGTLHSFLVAGMANRRQPLDAILTTAGRQNTYAFELYEDAMAILADPS